MDFADSNIFFWLVCFPVWIIIHSYFPLSDSSIIYLSDTGLHTKCWHITCQEERYKKVKWILSQVNEEIRIVLIWNTVNINFTYLLRGSLFDLVHQLFILFKSIVSLWQELSNVFRLTGIAASAILYTSLSCGHTLTGRGIWVYSLWKSANDVSSQINRCGKRNAEAIQCKFLKRHGNVE